MEFKGTKGKWKSHLMNVFVECEKPLGLKPIVFVAEYGDIKEFGKTSEEVEANAKLISKAPEMLDMLKRCERTLREVYEVETTEIKELIKQATEI